MVNPYRVRQRRERGRYDRETAWQVLDAGLVCHVGFVQDGEPFVIPMLYARDGDRLLLHGGVASRMLKALSAGVPVCVTVTHLDGLVLAASAFHHSANYRSVMVFGRARLISDPGDKARALDRVVEGLVPGRARDARPGNPKEVNATRVLELPIESFSVKIRTGGPSENEPGDPPDIWTGVIPVFQVAGLPEAGGNPVPMPDYVKRYRPGRRRKNRTITE